MVRGLTQGWIYLIAQKFRWIKTSLNTHTSYWHENFAEFNFAHSAGCSPESSEWSSRMNTPRSGSNIGSTVFARVQCVRSSSARSISSFLVSLVLACCMLFTAVLASAMVEGYSSDDRGPAESGKPEVQRGSTTVAASS